MKTPIPVRHSAERLHSRAGGFSLLELLLSLALLGVILAVALQGIVQLQQRNFADSAKVDTVQETRDFVDQMVRDIHDVGYPPPLVIKNAPPCAANPAIACGLVYFSPTQIQYEGDLDGTGTVYEVLIQLQPPASGKCPCVLQRGAVRKQDYLNGVLPTYFTEVNGVLNSGNGANGNGYGAATYPISLPGHGDYTAYGTADVFTSYDVQANPDPVGTCASAAACSSIRSLQITANVVPNYMDPKTQVFSVYSITSKGRFNNLTSPN